MTKIISMTQLKGGTGKSTVACLLAGEFSTSKKVSIIDADFPQASSLCWFTLRQQAGRDCANLEAVGVENYRQLKAAVDERMGQADIIIIDVPPRMADTMRFATISADLVLVPCIPSPADLWATADTLELLKEAKADKPTLQSRLVWSRARMHTRIAQTMVESANAELDIKHLASVLADRTAYALAFGDGLKASETTDSKAKAESKALAAEVQRLIRS